jgi:hypothetical protein
MDQYASTKEHPESIPKAKAHLNVGFDAPAGTRAEKHGRVERVCYGLDFHRRTTLLTLGPISPVPLLAALAKKGLIGSRTHTERASTSAA